MPERGKAVLLYSDKRLFPDGHILQARIWLVPTEVPGSRHLLKYSLFLGRAGERKVLYDNERLKGDHRHYGDREESYRFETVEKLVQDFLSDVVRIIGRADAGATER